LFGLLRHHGNGFCVRASGEGTNGEAYQEGLGIGLSISKGIVKAHRIAEQFGQRIIPPGGSLVLLPIATNSSTIM